MEQEGIPLSAVIRKRIQAKKARFHANDNISAFLKPGELDALVDEVAHKMQGVLESLVIDTKNDHNTKNTSRRVAKMFINEVFSGRYMEQPSLTKFPNVSALNELMIIGPITVMCRPQIQEEAVVELADMLENKIKPIGLAIVMDADHFCMQWRGVKDRDSKMVNSVMRGAFLKDSSLRREFLSLIDKR